MTICQIHIKEVNMNNKKVNKKNNKETYLFYPKEFSGYILTVILFTLIALPSGILSIILFVKERSNINELVLVFTIAIFGILPIMSIYFMITVIELIRKNIYVEINRNYIKIKRFYGEKSINISDIKHLKKISYYKNPFDYFVVSRKTGNTQSKNRIIRFPTIWFSDNDILKMVELLKNYKPSIEISGFYPKVLRVRNITMKKK